MRKRSNRMSNGYIGGPSYQQPYVDGGGIVNPMRCYLAAVDIEEWRRPSYWLPLPTMVQGDQLFAGLFAVFPGASGNTGASADSNFVALRCVGNYVVDWGVTTAARPNGYTTAHTSNTDAQYQYNWADIPASTETPEGYRQVIIKAYPQPGATLTTLNLQRRYTETGVTLQSDNGTNWLDIRLSAPSLSTIRIGRYSTDSIVHMHLLKQVHIVGTMPLTGALGTFSQCYALEKIIGKEWFANVTDATHFGNASINLRTVPFLDSRKLTNATYMFLDCRALERLPAIHFHKCTSFLQMFQEGQGGGSVLALKYLPKINTSKVQNWNSTFQRCGNLRVMPQWDFSSATDMTQAFESCLVLEELPHINAPNCTTFQSAFSSCLSLKKIAGITTSSATNMNGIFGNNYCMIQGPSMDTSKVTNFNAMFSGCINLMKVPQYNTSKGITFTSMFNGCTRLNQIPPIDVSGASAGTTAAGAGPFLSMFAGSDFSIKVGTLSGTRRSIDYSNCTLSPTELNNIFTNLGGVTVYGGATITITNNWGAASCDRTIATAKGWTVTG